MIISLKKEDGKGSLHHLLSGREYSIGRRNCNIIISDDQSISRKHAIIKVDNDHATLTDCNSKYKTFYQNQQVPPDKEIRLKSNDVIKFGVYNSIYKVEEIFVTTTSSSLSNIQKNKLKTNLDYIKGTLVDSWTAECTHLTVQEIVLTVKVLHAIIDEKPIVTTQYWTEYMNNVKNNLPLPDVTSFVPLMAEALLSNVSLAPNTKRKHLFNGKVFVFTTDKTKMQMDEIIVKTGGTALSWQRTSLTVSQVTNSRSKYIFIQSDINQSVPDSLKVIYNYLMKIGYRTIPLQEIAMAIVRCSCETNCNPEFHRVEQVFNGNNLQNPVSLKSLAPETQSQDLFSMSTKEEVIIPETAENSLGSLLLTTSKRSIDVTPNNSAKKIKLQGTDLVEEGEIEVLDTSIVKIENNNVSLVTENIFAKKRKSQDSVASSSKKPCKEENPFAFLRNKQSTSTTKSKTTNPFTNLRIDESFTVPVVEKTKQTEPLRDKNKELLREITVVTTVAPTVVAAKPKNVTVISPNVSNINRTNQSGAWLSKSICNNQDKSVELSDEMEQFLNKFKNTIITNKLPLVVEKIISNLDNRNITDATGNNFKKFKKVLPLRSQINIINTSVSSTCRGEALADSNSDDEVESQTPTRKKKHQFNF